MDHVARVRCKQGLQFKIGHGHESFSIQVCQKDRSENGSNPDDLQGFATPKDCKASTQKLKASAPREENLEFGLVCRALRYLKNGKPGLQENLKQDTLLRTKLQRNRGIETGGLVARIVQKVDLGIVHAALHKHGKVKSRQLWIRQERIDA